MSNHWPLCFTTMGRITTEWKRRPSKGSTLNFWNPLASSKHVGKSLYMEKKLQKRHWCVWTITHVCFIPRQASWYFFYSYFLIPMEDLVIKFLIRLVFGADSILSWVSFDWLTVISWNKCFWSHTFRISSIWEKVRKLRF